MSDAIWIAQLSSSWGPSPWTAIGGGFQRILEESGKKMYGNRVGTQSQAKIFGGI